jgi:glyoxylase-like metal-dependent hydrolase (beta-lactamase superfamily II)
VNAAAPLPPDVAPGRTSGIVVTGTAQREAWRLRVLPPVEALPGGIWSVPVVLTGHPLRYTLCYVLESSRGPVLIDPGWPDDDAWHSLVAGLSAAGMELPDVYGVLATHAHSDHCGLAGRVQRASGCWIGMHALDIELLRSFANSGATRQRGGRFLEIAGVPGPERPELSVEADRLKSFARTIPDRVVKDGAADLVPGRGLTARWTPGHTPGHLCFIDEAAGLAFTGDHLLPRITSHVGGYALDSGDVLGEYLTSVEAMSGIGDETEILPAHEYRFRGARARAAALGQHHAERLTEIAGVVAALGSATTWDVAERVHWSRGWAETTGLRRRLALAETMAHLRHLEAASRLRPLADLPARWGSCENQ